MVKGYCVKCRVKKDMEKITETELKNGRPAFYGFCPDCKTKMFRIGDLAAAKKKRTDGGWLNGYGKISKIKESKIT